jgi:hypothetical protein
MAQRKRAVLELAHPNAAGIDIGSASHFVAVSPDRDDESVREFKSFTEDLEELATGWCAAVWIRWQWNRRTCNGYRALYENLEVRGFAVNLVNARHVKNVFSRKSDVLDYQWLQ